MPIKKLLLLLVLALPGFATISSTTEWDVRTTGADTNGGAWDTSSSGTDYSQQDSPQVTYTDLVIDGTTNTKVTSAGNPFTSSHVGNIINVTSGTGFTVQRVQVVSVTGSTATCDKSLGTLSSTGGNGKLGGALANVETAFSAAQAGSTQTTLIHLKSGTYTRTTTAALTNTVGGNFVIIGYGSTHNDGGTRPLLTSATNSVTVVSLGSGLGSSNVLFENINFSHTAATRGILVKAVINGVMMMFDNCTLDGGTYAVIGDNGTASAGSVAMWKSEVKNCTTGGLYMWWSVHVYDSYFHDNTGAAIRKNSSQDDTLDVSGSIITTNTTGIYADGYAPGGGNSSGNGLGLSILRCTIANNTGDGIKFAANNTALRPIQIENNIIYGNGGWGINAATKHAGSTYLNKNNAFGSNTSGNANNWTTGTNPVTLTASPFTNSGTGDYSLNATAGGGALLKQAAYPGVFPGSTSTGYLDIGPVQTSGAPGTCSSVFACGFSQLRAPR